MVILRFFAFSASLAIALAVIASLRAVPDQGPAAGAPSGTPLAASARQAPHSSPVTPSTASLGIDSLTHYSDSLYGFDVAVPSGWQRIVTLEETPGDSEALDWSYAVGFESPRNRSTDRYADYVMIEVIPGTESGAFESNGQERAVTVIDGRPAVRDRVWLDSMDLQEDTLALVVYQATVSGIGYQIGLYAIGEQHEAEALGLAFDAMLHTFHLREEPYRVY